MARQLEHVAGGVEPLGDGLPRRGRPGEPGGAAVLKNEGQSVAVVDFLNSFGWQSGPTGCYTGSGGLDFIFGLRKLHFLPGYSSPRIPRIVG